MSNYIIFANNFITTPIYNYNIIKVFLYFLINCYYLSKKNVL